MKEYFLAGAAFISVPASLIAMTTSLSNNNQLDRLEVIVARQHDIIPQKIKKNAAKIPYVRRTITITDIEFNGANATVKFKDSIEPRLIYSQKGCPSIAKHIGKSFHVDYHTVKNVYEIGCNKFKL